MSYKDLRDLPEWKTADTVIKNHSIGISIRALSVTLAPNATMEDAFEEVNDFRGLTPAIVDSLRALARKIESEVAGTTIKIYKVTWMGVTQPGLSLDDGLVTIVALYQRPGTRLFLLKLQHTHYKTGSEREKLLHQFGRDDAIDPSYIWLFTTIPAAEIGLAEEVAKECGMMLTREIPFFVQEQADGTKKTFTYPMEGAVNAVALVNAPDSVVYGEPKSHLDLIRIEDMLIREFQS